MQYRPFGSLDFQVSALGFGTMRLPTVGGDYTQVDEPLAIEMMRCAFERGVNYADSGHPYHGGNSERVLGKALQDGYRDKVKVATKLPCWAANEPADFDRLLDEQLERLGLDHIDFYLLHNLQATLWPKVRDLGVLDWLEKNRGGDRFTYTGFSFHHSTELLTEIIDAYDGWTVCQIQYNYVNETVQAGTKGLEYAAAKGLAAVVMEPLLGGCLVKPPPQVQAVWDRAATQRTPVDWALQWLWHKPEVACVLSGMSAMEHVEENLACAERSGIGSLSEDELAVVARAQEAYTGLNVVPCTRCGYCMPCPQGVDIPRNLQLYNDALVYQGSQLVLNRNIYRGLPEEARASGCEACRECEEKCPQSIKISDWMPKVDEQFRR